MCGGPLPQKLGQVVGVEAESGGLGQERVDVAVGEGPATLCDQLRAGAGSDEHADAAAFDEAASFDAHVHSFRGGRGVDAVKGGEFVRRGRPRVVGEAAVEDGVFDVLGDLQEQRLSFFDHSAAVPG